MEDAPGLHSATPTAVIFTLNQDTCPDTRATYWSIEANMNGVRRGPLAGVGGGQLDVTPITRTQAASGARCHSAH